MNGSIAPRGAELEHDATAPVRLAFALNGDPLARFRAGVDPETLPKAETRWLNTQEFTRDTWAAALRDYNPEILVTGWGSRAVPEDYLADELCALRYVCNLTGSVRHVVSRALIERGLLVTNWGTSISHTIAEHAILLVLACLRNLSRWENLMTNWPGRRLLPTRRLRGKRVGLHGFGAVAWELVELLRPFGVTLTAYSAGVPAALYAQHGVQDAPDLESLFARSEVLIECEGLNSKTEGSVTGRVLRLLPAGAVFVNVGRSRIVDEAALAAVARERGLRLGVDVFNEEPPPPESALLHGPDSLFSPHIAGPTEDAFPLLWDHALQNVGRYLSGEEPLGQVTLEVYDRST